MAGARLMMRIPLNSLKGTYFVFVKGIFKHKRI